jgi:Trk-type K+ transport system membrane component
MRSIDSPGAQRRRRRRAGKHWQPAQLILAGFAAGVLIGTGLLMLPIATAGHGGTDLLTAFFHAVSAICVVGLTTVDTGTYWTGFGQLVILLLVQVGGFGIMAFASLLGVIVSRRLGLRSRLTAAAETKNSGIGGVAGLLIRVAVVGLVVELVCAVILTVRFLTGYHFSFGKALYHGVFHAITAFNNAGFTLRPDGLTGYVDDPWICLAIAGAVVLGSLGFPVLFELAREFRTPRRWSVHTKITVVFSGLLLVGGALFIAIAEWSNPDSIGGLSPGGRILAGIFHSVSLRTAGFSTVDIGGMHQGTWLGMDVLMFIGGGPAGTSGGIKVTTFAVLLFVIVAEARGDRTVNAFGRQISARTVQQAVTVALLSVAAVVVATIALVEITHLSTDRVLFEVVSAFGTTGLTTGITDQLPTAGLLLLTALMFLGRLGPVTLVSALALRESERRFDYPEGRPLIG